MKETNKSIKYWQNSPYLKGIGIDVGAGDDPLPYAAHTFDRATHDGDAQTLDGIPDGQYDYLYSSHCLEHMVDLQETFDNWLRVVKKYLYIVVPDYDLYEHRQWPSKFNHDHKHSFSLNTGVLRPNHWTVSWNGLYNGDIEIPLYIVQLGLQKDGYRNDLGNVDQTMRGALAQICFVVQKW